MNRIFTFTVRLALLMVLAIAVPVAAQTVVNPLAAEFSPSADHNASSGGVSMLDHYELEIFRPGQTSALRTIDLGKPAPGGDGRIRINLLTLISPVLSPGVVYTADVAAVGPGGRTVSPLSIDSFSFAAAPCTFAASPTSQSVAAPGGNASATVTTASGCNWTATSSAGWLTITSGASGSGNGTVSYTAAANASTTARSATLTAAGQVVTITQATAVPPITGDFNADGWVDLLWQNDANGLLSVWAMNGTSWAASLPVYPSRVADTNWKIVGTGDFNRDGQTDIFWQHQTARLMQVWMMNGTDFVSSGILTESGVSDTNWGIRTVADMNGDGWPDLIWQHQNGRIVIWIMNGTTYVRSVVVPESNSDPNSKIVAAADFDGDGDNDFLWHNASTGAMTTWLMNATAYVQSRVLSSDAGSDTSWRIQAVGDLNRDGKPDIILQHKLLGTLVAWLMDGTTITRGVLLNPSSMTDPNWRMVGPR